MDQALSYHHQMLVLSYTGILFSRADKTANTKLLFEKEVSKSKLSLLPKVSKIFAQVWGGEGVVVSIT